MSRYTTIALPDDDDEGSEFIDLPRTPRRTKREKPRFIKAELNIPENYREFQQAGIPDNALDLLEEFLKQFPSHEEIARWEAKGMKIAAWLNQQLYEAERLCLRIDALVQNFESLENTEVLLTQLKSTTTAVKTLQAKLDDQLFPWLTKSNFKKHRFTVLAFCLIVGSTIFFVRNGSSTSKPNPTPQSSSVPSTTTTNAKPSPN
jgi:hypothetical protein